MTHRGRMDWLAFGCALLTAALSACAQTPSTEPAMTNNPLLANPRPWCIGRMVMNRPAQSEININSYEFVGHKFEIKENVTSGTFQHTVAAREAELKTKKRTTFISYQEMQARGLKSTIQQTPTPWLEQAASPSPSSRLFIFKELADADMSFTGEGYVLVGSNMLKTNFALGVNAVQKVIQRDSAWFPKVTYRDNWTVPTEPGFCIQGALIGGPSRNSELAKQSLILMPGRASLFLIEMRDAVEPDLQSSLLKGLPDLKQQLRDQGYSHHVRILRQGKRSFAGMEAEEVLFSIKEGSVQIFQFYLIAPGNPQTTAQPHTEIQMALGDKPYDDFPPDQATSPVDEAGAIQTWDTLLDSVHLRPRAM